MEQIYTLTCDCCGGAFESPSGFPEIQLCPSCMLKPNKVEAKDTIIKEILAVHGYTVEEAEDILNNAGRAIYCAGIKEVVEWLDMIHNFVQEVPVEGGNEPNHLWSVSPEWIRKVVKERGKDAYYLRVITYDEWQAKLKEWGIE